MWSSAMHFAIGFFGYPFEGQYEQSVTIEHDNVRLRSLCITTTNIYHSQHNNTLSPYKRCVICGLSTFQSLTPPFLAAPTGITLKGPNVQVGTFAAGPRGAFGPSPYHRVRFDQSARRYLKAARERINAQLDGFEMDSEDAYAMQMMCAFEVDRPLKSTRTTY